MKQRERTIRNLTDGLDLEDSSVNINTCENCNKQNVCCIWRDFGKALVDNFGQAKEDYPINPFKLAQICNEYRPKRMMEA